MDKGFKDLFSNRFLCFFGFCIVIFIFAFCTFHLPTAHAQGAPEFLVTWKADSYAPNSFSGKLLPTGKSQVAVSFEVVADGKIVDVSKKTIYWYLNNKLLRGGVGLQSVSFFAGEETSALDMRIQFDDYFYNGNVVLQTFIIPVVDPEVVIEAPFPEGAVSDSLVEVMGRPYFFNITDPSFLSFAWEANGQEATDLEDPEMLQISFTEKPPAGTELKIMFTARDPENGRAEARKIISLMFK